MRLVDLPRTSSFRLALRFLILFGVASFALFSFLYWQTNQYIIGRIDAWLAHEQTILHPVDRIMELLFGLLMALSFTGALSVYIAR